MKSLLFALFIVAGTSVQAQTKVGYTNVELIMYYLPDAKLAATELQEYKKIKVESITNKRTRFALLVQEYQEKTQQKEFSGSQEETNLINEVSKLEKEINEEETNFEYRISQKQAVLLQPVMNKIQAAIDAVAEENGYTYILNQTTGTNILYGVKQFDVTDKIAAKLGINIPN